MRSDTVFLRCSHCKGVVEQIKAGAPVVCCGEPMKKLIPNTTDGATEKHVPAAARAGGKIAVDIGSVPHPMLPEHYIEWIAVVTDTSYQRIPLKPGDAPRAVFFEYAGPADVYEYCNLHGLWKSEI